MKRSRFTEDQIIGILKEHGEPLRRHWFEPNGEGGAEGSTGKKVVTPAAKRLAVAHLVAGHGMSERRACRMIGCCRMTMRLMRRSVRTTMCCASG
jgi:hypothetical protein